MSNRRTEIDEDSNMLEYGIRKIRRTTNSLYIFLVLCTLFIVQFPWYIHFIIMISDWRSGHRVELITDSLFVVLPLLPTILLIVLSVREILIAVSDRRDRRFVLVVGLMIIAACSIVVLAGLYWYGNIWLNRHGTLDMW